MFKSILLSAIVSFLNLNTIQRWNQIMTNNAVLLLFAIINVVVTGLFAGAVLRQYMRRRRTSQLYWSIALIMAFLATLAYVLMVIVGPTSSFGVALFRLYYIFGAALVPAWLGLGSIALVASARVTRVCLIVLVALSLLAVGLISTATIDMSKLSQIAGTPGTGILEPGAWLVTIIILNTLGVLAVVGVALYSAWKLIRRQSSVAGIQTINLLWANVLILVGDLLNAAAGSLARFFGLQSSFWIIQAFGWTVFFAGVLIASRRSTTTKQTSPEKAQVPA
jgi:hypothetical protein